MPTFSCKCLIFCEYSKSEKKGISLFVHVALLIVNNFSKFGVNICKSFENSVGKREIARNEQFLLFPQCFLPLWRTIHNFHQLKVVVYKLFQFERLLNLLFGKWMITEILQNVNNFAHRR